MSRVLCHCTFAPNVEQVFFLISSASESLAPQFVVEGLAAHLSCCVQFRDCFRDVRLLHIVRVYRLLTCSDSPDMGSHAHKPSLIAILQCCSQAFMPLPCVALNIGAILVSPWSPPHPGLATSSLSLCPCMITCVCARIDI